MNYSQHVGPGNSSAQEDTHTVESGSALALLKTLTVAMGQAATVDGAFWEILRLTCTQTQWSYGEVWLPGNGDCLRHSSIWYAHEPDLQQFGVRQGDGNGVASACFLGKAWARGQVTWLPDLALLSPEHFCRRDAALQFGLGVGVGVPILLDGEVLAVLVFLMRQVRPQDADQIAWIEVIAPHLGVLLRLKQTEAEFTEHQHRLHRLVDALPGIVFTAQGPPDWRMRSLSHGCYRLTGYTHEELTQSQSGISYNDITHPDDLPFVLRDIQAALEMGKSYEVEYRILDRQGREKWVWEKGQGIFDGAGTVQGLEGFITDITPLKQTEAALRQSEQRYRLLAERSQDLISQHDLNGVFRYVSPACLPLLGYDPETLLGQPAQRFFHPQDQVRILRHYRQFLRQGTVLPCRFRMRHQDGGYRWLETMSCLVDEAGDDGDRQILAVSRDVTDQVQAEQALMERERFLSLVLDNIPQRLFWKDRAGVYLGCNRAFAQSLGLATSEDIIGKTDDDIPAYSPDDAKYFRQQDQLIMRRNQPDLNVLELQPGQPRRWISASKLPIHDAQHQVVGVLGSIEDVSDRITFQQTLARREQYLTALVELQQQLLDFDESWDNERYRAVLQPLGEAAEASRVYIYEYNPARPEWALQRAEWSAPGIEPTVGHPSVTRLPAQGPLAPWVELLSRGHCINQTLDRFPSPLQGVLGGPPSNVKSILLLPLLIKGTLSGVIGFSNCEFSRRWTRSEVALLQVAANAIAIATERYQVAASLRQAEAKYRSMFENSPGGIFQSTPSGRYLTANPMLARIYGYNSPEELMTGLTDIERQLYVDPDRRETFMRRMLSQGAVIGFESAVYKKDGSIIWISESARTIYDPQGQLVGFEGTVEDITARKTAEIELHRRDRLLQGVAQASQHLLTAPDLEASLPQILSILGTAAAADRVYIYENHSHPSTGLPAMSMRHEWTQPDILPSINQPHWQNQSYEAYGLERWYRTFQAGHSIRGLVRNFPLPEQHLLALDGIQSILMVPIFIDQDLWGYIGFDACREAREWTSSEESILVAIAASLGGALKRQLTEQQMRYQAFHDPLTGLPNRIAFNKHLPLAIAQAERTQSQLAILFLDLDRFKTINDTLGHAVGDKLLAQATQRLTQVLRQGDMLARWGGDEFTLILPTLRSAEEAAIVAQRLANSLKPPFLIESQELYITSSIGIALYPSNGKDVTTLLQNADAAMYQAKTDGRNTYCFYTTTLNSSASRQLTLEKYLHHALKRNELTLFFQPQINVAQNQIRQVEALIRWNSPELGWVPPQYFIPVAEDIGLITEIGEWVLKQACYQLQTWHSQGFDSLGIAVNLSSRQLQQPSLVDTIERLLKGFDLSPACLELEITETAALLDIDASISTLNHLRQLGTRIAMDDFGTGYSSLSYLKRFPLQGLKIDRSFVRDIPSDSQDVAMLRAIIALGQELHLEVIAEGVETAQQLDCLQSLGCVNMQGYWFSRPLDGKAMTAFLQRHHL